MFDLIRKVQAEGDKALYSLTQQFDQVQLSSLRVSEEEFDAAMKFMQPKELQAFEQIISNLTAFHLKQRLSNYQVQTSEGVVCESVVVPIQAVGLYVPAGTAPLVSTVFMLGVASSLAACPLRLLCTPPNKNGGVDPYILVASSALWH